MPSVPNATTQGTWSDASNPMRRGRRSPMVLVFAGMMTMAVLMAGVLAFMRLRSPAVAVAGRSAMLFTTRMGEFHRALDQVKAEEKAEAERVSAEAQDKAKPAVPSSEPVAAKKTAANPVGGTGHASPRSSAKPNANDPHGGVTSAGF